MMPPFVIRLLALSHKELLHIVRDRQVIYLALGMPLVLVLLFGYAVSFDVENVSLAVVDQDRTPQSRRFVGELFSSDTFVRKTDLARPDDALPLFRRDTVKGVVVVPRGFARELARGRVADVQLVMDGADGTTTRIAVGFAAGIGQSWSMELLASLLGGSGGSGGVAAAPIDPRVRAWFNPRMRSAVFVVPGLVAVVLAVLSVLLSALTVAREWERGSMEQLFTTPVGRLSVVLGKLLPYVGLGLVQFLLVLAAGAWLFDVPLLGSFWLLLFATALFLACVLGQGLLISTLTRSQQVATQVGAVSSILPSLLISGFLFPIENMPALLQAISRVVPARYFIVCLRGILLQGRGVAQLWPDLLGLAVLAVLIVALSTGTFRRRLD